jgi:metal-responsive CopG/Arc/MetJ family transcriptional regulator
MKRKKQKGWSSFRMLLDADDLALLDRCQDVEKLSRSDIVRRALREFAQKRLDSARNATDQQQVA